ncbi:MAG: tRNA pseudouridine(13) synthase TruD, partial [Lysobacteraceae bacterium]
SSAGRAVRADPRSMLLSAARSELFNRVLAARVRDGSWDRGMEGEVWILAGTRSVFGPEPFDEKLEARLACFDIHPSGALWGAGELRTTGPCADLERAALQSDQGDVLCKGLEDAGLKQERRALRLVAADLAWEWGDADSLALGFSLPPGSYATAVLQELGQAIDASRS